MNALYETAVAASKQAPQVVIFTAPWCGPCKMVKPALVALKAEYGLDLTELNVEDFSPEDLQTLGVRNVPNVRVVHNTVVKAQFVGARTRAQVEDWLTVHGVIARGLSFE
ncbi:thioredoxin family protein [Paraburkholderia sp. RCC_158]|uniref:thioredoxin family protein n=1 Tax=Paraburkholderia sp. RCC_158 TaxID=3239220 RepID=UPI003523AD7F